MYEDLQRDFLEGLKRYKEMGVNPLSLATGCAVKVDLVDVVYPAIRKARGRLAELNVDISPREDTDIFVTRELKVSRVINEGVVDGQRAVTLMQVNQRTASSPDLFADYLVKAYSRLKIRDRLTVGKGHSITTSKEEGEVTILDVIRLTGPEMRSYTLTNNDTIQIIDPIEDPASQLHTDVAISNSLNDLFAKGAFRSLRMIPSIDAPTEDLRERILKNFYEFSKRYGVEIVESPQPEVGTFMEGATVIGETDHELPSFYDRVREGMEVLITRPMGELTPINLYMWMMVNPDLIPDIEEQGLSLSRVIDAKRKALEMMARPNLNVAEVIYHHLPPFKGSFSERDHIAMTTDVSGPGVMVVKEFAEKAMADVILNDVPVIDREVCRIATENFVIPNSTAGTNGGIVIFASKTVVDDLIQELKRLGHNPAVIGEVKGKGTGKVRAPHFITELIHRKNIIGQFEVD